MRRREKSSSGVQLVAETSKAGRSERSEERDLETVVKMVDCASGTTKEAGRGCEIWDVIRVKSYTMALALSALTLDFDLYLPRVAATHLSGESCSAGDRTIQLDVPVGRMSSSGDQAVHL